VSPSARPEQPTELVELSLDPLGPVTVALGLLDLEPQPEQPDLLLERDGLAHEAAPEERPGRLVGPPGDEQLDP
jgi:hypothetical protein